MAERSKARAEQEQPRLFEVLNRQPNGHETVHRFTATSAKDAVDQLVALGADREQAVEVRAVRPE